ncbi:MAG TPA: VWA domain-containing protein [Candidatus Baltobacteraceae bacterium]|jgi:Ca-activated chloride channel family protein
MSVQRPLALVLSILVAFAIAWLIAALGRRRRREAFTYSNLPFLLDAAQISAWPMRVLAGVIALGVLLGGVAFAGVGLVLPVPAKDSSIVLCLDTSGSMRATDVEPSREAAVRAAARAFVQDTPGGTRIGIVSFATYAQRVADLNDDKTSVLSALDNVPPANGATAIGDALALAGQMLPVQGHRAIVLVTDGVNNNGVDPLSTAQQLGARGISIYTVGIGTNGSGLAIPGTTEEASIDEDALREIATAGKGTYTRTVDAAAIAATFRDLARTTIWERRRIDVSFGLAIAGAGALVLGFVGALAAGRFP